MSRSAPDSSIPSSSLHELQLYFFLWSFFILFIISSFQFSLFSWSTLILLYFLWPSSFNILFLQNSFLVDIYEVLHINLLSPLISFLTKVLIMILLSPYALYLIFLHDIQPSLSQISLPSFFSFIQHTPTKNPMKLEVEKEKVIITEKYPPQEGDENDIFSFGSLDSTVSSDSNSLSPTRSLIYSHQSSPLQLRFRRREKVLNEEKEVGDQPKNENPQKITCPSLMKTFSSIKSFSSDAGKSPLKVIVGDDEESASDYKPKHIQFLDPDEPLPASTTLLTDSHTLLHDHSDNMHLASSSECEDDDNLKHSFQSPSRTPPVPISTPATTISQSPSRHDYLIRLQRVARQAIQEKKRRSSLGGKKEIPTPSR